MAKDQEDIHPPVFRLGLRDLEQSDLFILVQRSSFAFARDFRHLEFGADSEPLIGMLQEQPEQIGLL
jgi:hypothetical protein